MAIIAKGSGESFENAPTGLQQAVCVFVEDIGTHAGNYQGKPVQRHQVVICFELAAKMTLGEYAGKPFMLSNFYTLSLNEEARLAKDLENWFGKKLTDEQRKDGFDLEKLIGHNAMLNIVEIKKKDGTVRSAIGSVNGCPVGTPKISPVNTIPPKWISKKRMQSLEMQGGANPDDQRNHADSDTDLPF